MSAQVTSIAASEPVPASRNAQTGHTDPRVAALHRSVRAAIVPPATFAFTLLVVRDIQVATFSVFGCFALLVMADFGGMRRARAVAYLTATVVGAALVALGTALSPSLAAGSAVMLVVGFAVAMAGVFGGYVAAAQSAMLLAFVLAVTIPADVSAIPARMAGWALAGAVSTLAGVFFWPWFEQVTLRGRAAGACLTVADLVEAMRSAEPDELERRRNTARTAVSAIRAEYGRSATRPSGPTRRDRAFVELMTELEEIVGLVDQPFAAEGRRPARPCIDEGDALLAAVLAALRSSAAALTGRGSPDVRALIAARRAHRAALDAWAVEQVRAGRSAEDVLDGIDVDHTLRVVAYLTIALSANAVIAAGGRAEEEIRLPVGIPRLDGARGVAGRVMRTLRAHVDPDSTVLHHSIRLAVGLALSVLLARALGLGHAFWVVLGTLSVLRSNALGTGRSTVDALIGSVIGFVLGGLFAAAAGTDTVLMWIALPVGVFFATYAASAIGFVAGQAAFTIMVIVIFNLISPAGWQVGLVRVEDVAIGTGISVVVGVLLWPRGARRDLARATAGYYRALVAYLDHAFHLVLGGATLGATAPVRAAAVRAQDRAGQAFDTFLSERGAKPLDSHAAARLVSTGNQSMLAADALVAIATDGYRADPYPDGAATVEAQVHALLARFGGLADNLQQGAHPQTHPGDVPPRQLRDAAIEGLRRAQAGRLDVRAAMALVIAGEWVENLTWLAAHVDESVDAAADAAGIRWWR